MRLPWFLALLATACTVDEAERPLFPANPGLGNQGGLLDADLRVDVDAAPFLVEFDLCVVEDYRFPDACPGYAARINDTWVVTIRETEDTHSLVGDPTDIALGEKELGTFVAFPTTRGATLVQRYVQQTVPLLVATHIDTSTFPDPVDLGSPTDRATIALYLVNEHGRGVAGARVEEPAGTSFAPFYAGAASPLDWSRYRDTGDSGAVLLFGVPTDQDKVSLRVRTATGKGLIVRDVPVRASTTTFHTVTLRES